MLGRVQPAQTYKAQSVLLGIVPKYEPISEHDRMESQGHCLNWVRLDLTYKGQGVPLKLLPAHR